MGFLRLRKKKKQPKVETEGLRTLVQEELDGYVKREEVQEYLKKIQKDERRRRLWDSLSARKKIQVLKYALAKKGEHDGKK